jgi:hypothetical protein
MRAGNQEACASPLTRPWTVDRIGQQAIARFSLNAPQTVANRSSDAPSQPSRSCRERQRQLEQHRVLPAVMRMQLHAANASIATGDRNGFVLGVLREAMAQPRIPGK